jgi:DNA-binding response OmpR family regulator
VERLLREDRSASVNVPARTTPMDLGRLKVLVVEDDNTLLKLYRIHMTSWSMPIEVITAANGYDALVLIGREQPDLMIADLNMPGLDGFQMVHSLSSSSFREGMEIVVVTGLDAADVAARGGLPEGVRLFPKPVPFAELRAIVAGMLEHRATYL